MQYSQSPPIAENEWPTTEARDLDNLSDRRIGVRRVEPPIHSPQSTSVRRRQVAIRRPSVGRRIFRTLIAVFIGVSGTLACESHGDDSREIVLAHAPTL